MDELKSLVRAGLALACLAALSACKLEITVPDGGSVRSESGAYFCRTGDTCTIDVVDFFFNESFVAEPAVGYTFTGWRSNERGLCGGNDGKCKLSTTRFFGNPVLLAFLESDEVFYLEPEFEMVNGGPLFNLRYCEIILPNLVNGVIVNATVYGTQGLNNCPADLWNALDGGEIAREFNTTTTLFNGPRYWVLDLILLSPDAPEGAAPVPGGETVLFGDLEMRELTTVDISNAAAAAAGLESGRYETAEVDRFTRFIFVAGRRVYELINPDGVRYMMQSFSQLIDPLQSLNDLAHLGDRLSLPPGWRFETRILEENFALDSVDGIAEVVTDDFSNTYQRVP